MNSPMLLAQIDRILDDPLRSGMFWWLLLVVAAVLILFGILMFVIRQFKRCPSNRVLVIYGRTGKAQVAKPIHGGWHWVVPLAQAYDWLYLEPMQIEIPLRGRCRSRTSASTCPACSRWPSAPRPS